MNIEVRPATREDALYIAKHLRDDDTREVKAAGMSPESAVLLSFAGSDTREVCCVEGKPALIYGAMSPLHSDVAAVWALGTPDCDAISFAMVKRGRAAVRSLLDQYPRLENYCIADYEKSIRWLRLLGFAIGDPEPYGVNGELFCKLSITKE
jgi:hypothetical protein